jgi:hypothetical protein
MRLMDELDFFKIQASTHPPIASLGHPLFGFAGKRVGKFLLFYPTFKFPLSATGEERDGERSDARVSQLYTLPKICTSKVYSTSKIYSLYLPPIKFFTFFQQ